MAAAAIGTSRQPAYVGAIRQTYARVRVIQEHYDEWLEFLSTLKTRGRDPKKSNGLTWPYDGMEYPIEGPLKPGQVITLPIQIAMHGVKLTSAWYQELVDGLPRLDYRANGKPLMEIVETFEPEDIGELLQRRFDAQVPSKCSWCSLEVPPEEFQDHVEEHFRQRPVTRQEPAPFTEVDLSAQ